MKKLLTTIPYLSAVSLIALSLVVTGCATTGTKVTGVVEDKTWQQENEACYYAAGSVVCHPLKRMHYLWINGKPVPFYEETWNKYKIGDQYP